MLIAYAWLGNSLNLSLLQSHIDISTTPMHDADREDRIKSCGVNNASEFIAIIDCLSNTLANIPCFVILEGLTPLLVSLKVRLLVCYIVDIIKDIQRQSVYDAMYYVSYFFLLTLWHIRY